MIQQDCFGYVISRNECKCLKNLVCRSKKCPFYKSEKQYNEELKKHPIIKTNSVTALNPYEKY